jgi:PAS domain S-box-containing protein
MGFTFNWAVLARPKLGFLPVCLCREWRILLRETAPFVGIIRHNARWITPDILAEIGEIASDAVISMDALQRVTFFNKGAEAIFGWTPGEIIGQRIETLIPERYRGNHERQVETFGKSKVKARRMGERREIAGIRKTERISAEAAISQVGEGKDIVFHGGIA